MKAQARVLAPRPNREHLSFVFEDFRLVSRDGGLCLAAAAV
jgi:hypothetical protein